MQIATIHKRKDGWNRKENWTLPFGRKEEEINYLDNRINRRKDRAVTLIALWPLFTVLTSVYSEPKQWSS